jgi:hypothetical protein
MQRKREFMSNEVWDVILNCYIVPYMSVGASEERPATFIGHKDGEPLLNKKLPDRLRSLPRGIKIDIYSHGLMLPKLRAQGRDFMEFLASLPNKVRYMMSYHPVNGDGSKNDYSDTVQYLRSILCDPPKNVEFIAVSHRSRWVTEETQEQFKWWFSGLPITVHCNTDINPWTGRIAEATCKYHGCPYADFGHWFFGVSGNVIACCLDLEEDIVLGNVLTNEPDAMFKMTSDFYEDQRRRYEAKERPKYRVCNDCFGVKELVQLEVRS